MHGKNVTSIRARGQAAQNLFDAMTGGIQKSQKGVEGGNCNRTACQAPGATFYNASTMKWYCPKCYEKINDANPGLCVER
jgi:hypothetical protein